VSEEYITINDAALQALNQREFYQAQTLLRENAKKNPSLVTFNNLGAFYVFEGMVAPDESYRSAKKQGIKYLEKALSYQNSRFSFSALGYACFETKDFKGAAHNFGKAYEIIADYVSAYNKALSYYRKNEYVNALTWSEKACSMCEESEYFETYALYLFSLLQVDKDECSKKLHHLFNDSSNDLEIEKFALAYFCNDLQLAAQQANKMLEFYIVNLDIMAMVFDCLIKTNNDNEAIKYLEQKIEILKEYDYNVQPQIKRLKKALFNEEYRQAIISSFQYIKPLIAQCCYYGCKAHNNPIE